MDKEPVDWCGCCIVVWYVFVIFATPPDDGDIPGLRWRGCHNSAASFYSCAAGFRLKSVGGCEQVSLSPHGVLALEVPDCPGGLADILAILDRHELSVEYMYAFVSRDDERAYLIMRVPDNEAAMRALQEGGHELLDENSVYKM